MSVRRLKSSKPEIQKKEDDIKVKTMVEATNMLARNEGVLLDPVYSGKGMAGLIGQIQSGKISKDGDVIFLHTGGAVSLFAYEDQFSSQLATH